MYKTTDLAGRVKTIGEGYIVLRCGTVLRYCNVNKHWIV